MFALPFLIIAVINVVYVWRRTIGKVLKSLLSEEQYAALLQWLEIQRGTGPWEWAEGRLQNVHSLASNSWARWRGNGFTRVASSRPLEGIGNFYEEGDTDFSVDTTSSCDWGCRASSTAPMPPAAEDDNSSTSSDEDQPPEHDHGVVGDVDAEAAASASRRFASISEEQDGSSMHVVV